MKMKIDMEHWNKTLGCYRTVKGVVYKWLGGDQWRLATKEEQTIKLIEDKPMPNIKITAEVDGKQVPLSTISTESFEAIKALQKPKEIPVARVGDHKNYPKDKRLFIRPTTNINLKIGRVYSFDLADGALVAEWDSKRDEYAIANTYENVLPL